MLDLALFGGRAFANWRTGGGGAGRTAAYAGRVGVLPLTAPTNDCFEVNRDAAYVEASNAPTTTVTSKTIVRM
jgi:hypothetical protein